ncbi:MAG: hypothetical protein IKS31_03150 [Clostridia bacterium]|nr:hypothetical protein [Clostridia bacterium]
MKRTLGKRAWIALCLACVLALLTGCAAPSRQAEAPVVTFAPTEAPTAEPAPAPTVMPAPDPTPEPTPNPTARAAGMTPQQTNAINILNYLRALAQEIRASSNSRLYLEECYSMLLNNTHPNAIDQATLEEVMSLTDTLERYRMVAVKRDRLQYIYEQNKAQAMRKAIPKPRDVIRLIKSAKSINAVQLVTSVAFMALDSVANYKSALSSAELQYLQDSWELDDEQSNALHNSRKQLYAYMINMVHAYDLQGDLALNENLVDEFVTWKNNTNVTQRIQFLEANRESYQAFGQYWLTLAESYYENKDYAKCLSAVKAYEDLDMKIFRKDYDYARVLPMAITAAQYTMEDADYIAAAERYCRAILDNTDNSEWSLRYFAAQIYIDLYGKTEDKDWLKKAYDIALNNVNSLVGDQRTKNAAYLADVVEQSAPKGETETAKKDREQYNKLLKETRKTELAPVSEPLLLNCELLFALADELEISDAERGRIDSILHQNGEPLFLIEAINNRFTAAKQVTDADDIEVTYNGKDFTIPAKYVSAGTVITVTTAGRDGSQTYGAADVSGVDRKGSHDVKAFTVTFKCDDITFEDNEQITITVTPQPDLETETYTFRFKTEKPKYLGIAVGFIEDMKFNRIK